MVKLIAINIFKFFCYLISILLLLLFLLFARLSFGPISLDFALNQIEKRVDIPNNLHYSTLQLIWKKETWGPAFRLKDVKWDMPQNTFDLGDISLSMNFKKLMAFDGVFDNITIEDLTITILKKDNQFSLLAFNAKKESSPQPALPQQTDYSQIYTYLKHIGGLSFQDIEFLLEDRDDNQTYSFPHVSLSIRAEDDQFHISSHLSDNYAILKKDGQISATLDKDNLSLKGRIHIDDFDLLQIKNYNVPKIIRPFLPSGQFPGAFFATFDGSLKDIKNIQLDMDWKLRSHDIDVTFPDTPEKTTYIQKLKVDGHFSYDEMMLKLHSIELEADPSKPIYLPQILATYRAKTVQATGYFNIKSKELFFSNIKVDTGEYIVEGVYKTQFGGLEEKHFFSLSLPVVDIRDVMKFWPQNSAKEAWAWINENLTEAKVKGIFGLRIIHGADNIWHTYLSSKLNVQDATLHYYKEAPDILIDNAEIYMQGENIVIDQIKAESGGLNIQNAKAIFSELQDKKIPKLDVQLKINNDSSNILQYITAFSGNFFEGTDYTKNQFSGQVQGDFGLKIPLSNQENMKIDQVNFYGKGIIKDAKIKNIIDQKNLTSQSLSYQISHQDFIFTGATKLQGQPINLKEASIKLTDNNVSWKLNANANIPVSWLKKYNSDIKKGLEPIKASGMVKVDVQADSAKSDKVGVSLDLKKAKFQVDALHFKKDIDQAALVSSDLIFKNKTILLPNIYLKAKNLTLSAHTQLTNRKIGIVVIDSIKQKRSNLSAQYEEGKEQNKLNISGTLDLAGENTTAQITKNEKNTSSKPINISLNLKKVWMEQAEFNNVKGQLIYKNGYISWADITAKTKNSAPIKIKIRPKKGYRDVNIQSSDGGAIIRGFGVSPFVFGGSLYISAIIDDSLATHPFKGQATLSDFTVKDASALVHLLGVLSLSQLKQSLLGNGLAFQNAHIPFILENNQLYIEEGIIEGNALGGTVDGQVGLLKNGSVNLSGKIIPFNSFSGITSKIPLLGMVLTGTKGEGIFAADYKITGTKEDFDVKSNPLTAIAPGVFRDIFHIFSGQ